MRYYLFYADEEFFDAGNVLPMVIFLSMIKTTVFVLHLYLIDFLVCCKYRGQNPSKLNYLLRTISQHLVMTINESSWHGKSEPRHERNCFGIFVFAESKGAD